MKGFQLNQINDLVHRITNVLTDELRRPPWRGQINLLAGHCYCASEALYHALGGKAAGWKPMFVRHETAPHWFIRHQNGWVLDITALQFKTPVQYDKARGKGFLTTNPSARARLILERAGISL